MTRQDLPLPPKPNAPPPEPAAADATQRIAPPPEPGAADATQHLTPPPAGPTDRPTPVQGMPAAPSPAPGPAAPAYPVPVPPRGENWHRLHYPVGIFLVVYGLTALLASLVGWSDHRADLAGYLRDTVGAAGAATPALVAAKVVQAALVLIALAGLVRRRDVLFLPVLFGWSAGFAVFCVLDLWSGRMGRLLEHGIYLAVLLVLLAVSYALSVKVRVGRTPAPAPAEPGAAPAPAGMSRTQEIALAALNRWQRQSDQPSGPPPSGPPPSGPPPA
ncbi:hypothetical protein DPM19_26855 [Actinomadura craniellae]|uniref:Uncharacterized protein n=1 Tax=Actinomadura craniellae TaxID=2231787 RepID=A0A365H1A6_9ACTN|nr:hypothetical protein DPM19_26855 [Actinomadura craniellae]